MVLHNGAVAWFGIAALCIVCTSSARAEAQVNAEVLRPNPLRAGWAAGLNSSFALSRGNIELLDIGASGRVLYQTLHPSPLPAPQPPQATAGPAVPIALPFIAQRAFISASARFAERGISPFINQAFVHARWTAMWHERVGSDLFAQLQFNEFLRLQARAVTGAGIRVELVHHRSLMLSAGSGYLFEYNKITVSPGAADAPETFEHRWTNYLTARVALLNNQLLLQNTLYYQPRWDLFSDFRLLEEFELLARVTELFAFGTTLSVLHDSAPPLGVQSTDLRLMSTVALNL